MTNLLVQLSLTAWFHSRAVAMTTTVIDPTPCWILLTMSHRVKLYIDMSDFGIIESDIALIKSNHTNNVLLIPHSSHMFEVADQNVRSNNPNSFVF